MIHAMMYFYFLLLIGSSLARIETNGYLPNGGKIWALLVAGSNGYDNYRHQADVCHAYQLLHSNGIPDEQIIVMMYDDIAHNKNNPTPGKIINIPGGPDVYKGVPIDYAAEDVNPTNFLNVLRGNSTAVKNIGTGRVIKSGPNDHIFVNFVDHGSPGMLLFPSAALMADDLAETLKDMAGKSQFDKMVLYIEACHAGSMFDDILPDDLNVFVTTASDPHESSYACYYDEERLTYLGDCFSVIWLNDASVESGLADLNHQFEKIRTKVNLSHVEEYGDLDIGNTHIKEFIGFKMSSKNCYEQLPVFREKDFADNHNVPLIILENRIEVAADEALKLELQKQRSSLLKKRKLVDDIVNKIINRVTNDETIKQFIETGSFTLGKTKFPCYRKLVNKLSKHCFNIIENPYLRTHLKKFINMCAYHQISPSTILEAMESVCGKGKFTGLKAV